MVPVPGIACSLRQDFGREENGVAKLLPSPRVSELSHLLTNSRLRLGVCVLVLQIIMLKRARDEGEENEEASRHSWLRGVASATNMMLKAIEARQGVLAAKAEEVGKARQALAEEKAKARQEYGAATAPSPEEWVRLNVQGERMAYRRSDFAVETARFSFFSAAFNGDWDRKMPRDREGRVLLEENPKVWEAVMTAILTAKVSGPVSQSVSQWLLNV